MQTTDVGKNQHNYQFIYPLRWNLTLDWTLPSRWAFISHLSPKNRERSRKRRQLNMSHVSYYPAQHLKHSQPSPKSHGRVPLLWGGDLGCLHRGEEPAAPGIAWGCKHDGILYILSAAAQLKAACFVPQFSAQPVWAQAEGWKLWYVCGC